MHTALKGAQKDGVVLKTTFFAYLCGGKAVQ